MQVGAVRVVDEQQHAVAPADGRERADVGEVAEVIRACDIDGRGPLVRRKVLLEHRGLDRAGDQAFRVFGVEPVDVQTGQRGGGQKDLVRVAPGGDDRPQAVFPGVQTREVQHGADAQRGALRRVQRARRAEQARGVFLALPDDALGPVQLVGAVKLRDVERFHAEQRAALVAGHVQAQRVPRAVAAHKIAERRFHHAFSRDFEASSMSAHSMRFLKSSQPAPYTPRTEPVAW